MNEFILERKNELYIIRKNEIISLIYTPKHKEKISLCNIENIENVEFSKTEEEILIDEKYELRTIYNTYILSKKEYNNIKNWIVSDTYTDYIYDFEYQGLK